MQQHNRYNYRNMDSYLHHILPGRQLFQKPHQKQSHKHYHGINEHKFDSKFTRMAISQFVPFEKLPWVYLTCCPTVRQVAATKWPQLPLCKVSYITDATSKLAHTITYIVLYVPSLTNAPGETTCNLSPSPFMPLSYTRPTNVTSHLDCNTRILITLPTLVTMV